MSKENKRTSSHFQLNEPLLFEEGSPGRRAFDLPALDVVNESAGDIVGANLLREDLSDMPELSEAAKKASRSSNSSAVLDLVPPRASR